MKRFQWKQSRLSRRIAAIFLCATMAVSMIPGKTYVHATESGTDATVQSGTSTETTNIDANGTLGKNSDVGIELTKSITGKTGKSVEIAFNLLSNNTSKIKLKSVYPVIDATFPFETSGDAYKIITAGDDAAKQQKLNAVFKMTARSDLEVGYHSIRFIGEYTKVANDGSEEDFYVIKTINIYFSDGESSESDKDNSSSGSSGSSGGSSYSDDDDSDSSSGYSGGGYSGGDSDDDSAAPKLIIKGFETKPAKVMAGETFKLTLHIQNTSKNKSVNNGKFLIGNEAGNFIPTAGSNAVYVEKIGAGETGDLEIELKTSADLAQKNYVLVVKGDYDTGSGTSYTYSDNFYVPIYQEVKLAITDVSMTPESIGIDSEGSLMFTINNQGNAGVYNVNVTVNDTAVTAADSYVGNIAANSSAYATVNVVGAEDNSDRGTVHVIINYEDSEGNAGKIEEDIACSVGEDVIMDEFEDMGEEYDESDGLPTWLKVLFVIIGLGAVAAVVVILVIKKKKKMAELLADNDEDVDGEDVFEDEDF